MKSSLIRILMVMTVAFSLSVFAMSENPKAATYQNSGSTNVGAAMASNASLTYDELLEKVDQLQAEVQQLQARDKASQREQQTEQENTKKNIQLQEKEWEHSLMGIYGG